MVKVPTVLTYLQHSMGRHFLSKSQSLPPRLSWIGIRIQPCPTMSSHNWPSWSKAASPSSVLLAKSSSSSSDGGSCISTESSAMEQEHQSKRRQEAILNNFILVLLTYVCFHIQ